MGGAGGVGGGGVEALSYPGVFTGGKSPQQAGGGWAEEGDRWGHWEARGTPEGRQGYWLASEGEEERRRGEEARWEEE